MLAMPEAPWDYSTDLARDRLITMARLIARIRDEVIELFNEELGDTRLSLGTRAYECCRTRIIKETENNQFPWLSILTPEGRFTFKIGDTPVRFTRNDPDNLPGRKLITSEETMKQMDLFSNITPYAAIIWFFVFDTYYQHAADAVYFVGYSESGDIICKWQIPLEEEVTLIHDATSLLSAPVELPEPVIGIKKPDNRKRHEDHEDDGR